MALFAGKNQALQIPSPPNLPLASMDSSDRLYLDQLNNVMRLYFTQISSALSTITGDEGGQYMSFPFGSFYDTTTQTAAATSTAYAVKFNTTESTNSILIANDGSSNPTRLTVNESGIYNFVFSLQAYNSGGSAGDMWIWIRVNGTDVPFSMGRVTVPAGQYLIQSWNFFPALIAKDYVQLMWAVSDTNVKLQAITAPAFAPASPSAALTGNFISYTPANPSA
jgi:hypothetical protein